MASTYQDRIFVSLLDPGKETSKLKEVLKSPLELSLLLVKLLFEQNFNKLRDDLDQIKFFVAGITRAENVAKSTKYTLASQYPNMFAFHQFFHSSYRARQGKVLERMLMSIIGEYTTCDKVPSKSNKMLKVVKQIFDTEISTFDIDALGSDSKNKKTILIQLRSRDDTGGTTAKGSLVDLLRDLLRLNKIPSHDLLYVVSVWDERESQQKKATITKIYSSLKNLIQIKQADFKTGILKGIELKKNITLKLAYGTDEIASTIFVWSGSKNKKILESISEIISYCINWDDLWISYAIANLELQTKSLHGYTNITLLSDKYAKAKNRFNFDSYQDLVNSINLITSELMPIWTEDTIPLSSTADRAHYIRDLLFLLACYEKHR
jgi:hypothetical protein